MELTHKQLKEEADLYLRLRHEQDGRDIIDTATLDDAALKKLITELKNSETIDRDEPNSLGDILKLGDFDAPARKPNDMDKRIFGAIAGRFAGCTLGVPVEGFSIADMEKIARDGGTPFPPTEYWHTVVNPDGIQYGVDKRSTYTLGALDCVPVDDDITYPVLCMLQLKRYGESYTVEDVAEIWQELLPYACTAEDRALKRMSMGFKGEQAADDNPFVEWIGASIRADVFGYVCAGDPVRAAKLCYNDAYLTHRRNGIYGEMFNAAAIAAAFTMEPLKAIETAARCIPRGCKLKGDIDWALSMRGKFDDHKSARALIDERFSGMNSVHIRNNVCAEIFALMLGNGDFTQTIAQSVAIGLDNDCNAATVGSIVGAYLGTDGIDKRWYEPFDDKVHTYLKGYEVISLKSFADEVMALYKRFNKEAA